MKLLATHCVAYDSFVSNHFVRGQTTGNRASNNEQKSLSCCGNKECYCNTKTFLARPHVAKIISARKIRFFCDVSPFSQTSYFWVGVATPQFIWLIYVNNFCKNFERRSAHIEIWFICVTPGLHNPAVPHSSGRHDVRWTQKHISSWWEEIRKNSNGVKI